MSCSLPPRSPYASMACCWDSMKTFPYLEVKGYGLEGVDFDSDDNGNENKTEVREAWNTEDHIDNSNEKDGKLHLHIKICDIRKHSTCCNTCEGVGMSYRECIAFTTPLHKVSECLTVSVLPWLLRSTRETFDSFSRYHHDQYDTKFWANAEL